MRRAARKDANHRDIVDGLRVYGYSVLDLSRLGDSAPDCLVGDGEKNTLLEIKTATGKLSAGQKEFFQLWRGPKAVVRSLDEALKIIKKGAG